MTHIVPVEKLPEDQHHYLLRKDVNISDKIIFQTIPGLFEHIEEMPVVVTVVQREPGLMKGFCIISWNPSTFARGENKPHS